MKSMKIIKSIFSTKTLSMIVIIFFVVFGFLPMFIMLVTSFKDEMQLLQNFWGVSFPLRLENYTKAWEEIYIYFLNSLKVTMLSVIGIVAVSLFAGYAFAKMQFKGKNAIFLTLISFRMVPTGLLIIPMFMNIYSYGLNNNHFGVILPNIAGGCIMGIMLSKGFFAEIPDSIFESARIDGASELRLITSFVLPLSIPIIGTIAVFNFFGTFNQYMWPYIVLSDNALKTVPIGLARLAGEYGLNFGLQMAGYTIASVPLIILFLCTSRIYISGITSGAVKA